MMKIMTSVAFIMFGSVFGLLAGSFAGATVWRLRARQLAEDDERLMELTKRKKLSRDERLERAELAEGTAQRAAERHKLDPLLKKSFATDRSRCLTCHHTLAWYDLLPLASWLGTGGRCRYCRTPIGRFEPLMELGSALLFGLFAWYWTANYAQGSVLMLAIWAVILVLMVVAFAYDAKWFLLPDTIMWPLIILSGIVAGLGAIQATNHGAAFLSAVGAVLILSGLYLALWLLSRGAWIGFGDVKLGLALGLLLGQWQYALLALFLANCIGLLFVLPGLLSGRLSRHTHVPFGPFLIIGFFVTLFWGQGVIQLYQGGAMLFSDWLITLMV